MTRNDLIGLLIGKKLQKVKTKMIKEALEKGSSERGNHKVVYLLTVWKDSTIEIHAVNFYYRGTNIARLRINDLKTYFIDAGEFESTPATMRQRKDIMVAIDEIRDIAKLL